MSKSTWGIVPPASNLAPTLAVKYRPCKLSEFWNYPRDPALRRLVQEMKTNTLRSVLVFIAPFSGAKTSVARFMGQWTSCLRWQTDPLPCGECDMCRTVMYGQADFRGGFYEINAATNWAEETIWEAINMFGYSTVKVNASLFTRQTDNPRPHIIFVDEVQRLPPRVQDKFLKPVEKMYSGIFVLATDDKSKVDGGLLSRGHPPYCFTHPTPEEAAPHLVRIARSEGFELSVDLA
ncbi:MAG: hypothetical protein FWD53_06180, partial [Phycisphaerales bacterium]|nr:hypothetical protein [Phycisphaerales bacterium]